MNEALSSSLGVVAYLALFFGVGLLFIFVNLLVGRFLRPSDPHEEKLEIYECGEPTIGSGYVQFDLRFYVVALLFIIFDVEVAFFFPWATVFGKANHLADENLPVVVGADQQEALTEDARALYQELGVNNANVPDNVPPSLRQQLETGNERIAQPVTASGASEKERVVHAGARQLALITIVDIGVFFAVLMVGFAYVWRRGDLDWVRAVTRERSQQSGRSPPGDVPADEPVLTA